MINQNTFTGPSFSVKNRAYRVIWNISYLLLFRYTPKVFFGWRRFVLRCFGANIGKKAHVYPGVKIWAPYNLKIGQQSGIASGSVLYNQGEIFIGDKTVISQGVNICTGTHDYTKAGFPLLTSPIYIGNHVWIAADAFIHPGVTIADGCVVGARAVVINDMPEWMVCAGHPCKPIKPRSFE
jgi:putative colanic acid biosynthesis acetyltransferase WcaF